jgi:hypothetical protein
VLERELRRQSVSTRASRRGSSVPLLERAASAQRPRNRIDPVAPHRLGCEILTGRPRRVGSRSSSSSSSRPATNQTINTAHQKCLGRTQARTTTACAGRDVWLTFCPHKMCNNMNRVEWVRTPQNPTVWIKYKCAATTDSSSVRARGGAGSPAWCHLTTTHTLSHIQPGTPDLATSANKVTESNC